MSRPAPPWPSALQSAFADLTLVCGVLEACRPLYWTPPHDRSVTVDVVHARCWHPPTAATRDATVAAANMVRQGTPYDLAFLPLRQLQDTTRDAAVRALADWHRTNAPAADRFWTTPPVSHLPAAHPALPALQSLFQRLAVDGTISAATAWQALLTFREPVTTLGLLWRSVATAWESLDAYGDHGHLPAVRFVDDALLVPTPTGKQARDLHTRWRREATTLLARAAPTVSAQQIVARRLSSADLDAPLTYEQVHVTTCTAADPMPDLLALARRLPIPSQVPTSSQYHEETAIAIASTLRAASGRHDALWRTLWARATTVAQQQTLLFQVGFRQRGPWWFDAAFATDALTAMLAMEPSAIRMLPGTGIMHILDEQVGRVEAALWLRVAQRHDRRFPAHHLGVLLDRAAAWPIEAEALLPLLQHEDVSVRETAQLALAACRPCPDVTAEVEEPLLAPAPTRPIARP